MARPTSQHPRQAGPEGRSRGRGGDDTTLAGFAVGTAAGRLLWQDINAKFNHQQGHHLGKMVLREFEKRPSGLVLPRGKIAKRFDGERVRRVMWKIARGLYFHEKGRVMPEVTPAFVRLTLPGEAPPPEIRAVLPEPEQGRYPGIFAYRHKVFPEAGRLHAWAFLFWDAIACSVASHDPACVCLKCSPGKGSAR